MTALKLTQDNFEQEVLKADKPVLVDFWAPWCGPCRMVSPIVEEIAGEVADRAKVGKVNVCLLYTSGGSPSRKRIGRQISGSPRDTR